MKSFQVNGQHAFCTSRHNKFLGSRNLIREHVLRQYAGGSGQVILGVHDTSMFRRRNRRQSLHETENCQIVRLRCTVFVKVHERAPPAQTTLHPSVSQGSSTKLPRCVHPTYFRSNNFYAGHTWFQALVQNWWQTHSGARCDELAPAPGVNVSV